MDFQNVVSGGLREEQIQQDVRSLGKWFHNINLNGVFTAPNHFLGDYPNNKFMNFADSIPKDLRGRTVLDIGCNAGLLLNRNEKSRGSQADRIE